MRPDQEKWINKVLSSLNGIERTNPSPFLFAKIRHRLTSEPAPVLVSKRTVWLAAASFAVLVLLNWGLLSRSSDSLSTQSSLDTVIQDMQLYPSVNQLYNAWNEQNY